MEKFAVFMFAIAWLTSCLPEVTLALCNGPGTNRVSLVALLENSMANCDMNSDINRTLSLALAAEYVIDLVNNNQTDLGVPGVTYDLEFAELKCDNQSLAVRTASMYLPLHIWKTEEACPTVSEANLNSSLMLGFIGPLNSINVKAVAQFLNNTDIPLITPTATLPELSQKDRYHTLFRTATSDVKQAQALVEAAELKGWSYVLLVHTNDLYGMQGAAAVEEYGRRHGICFQDKISVDTDPLNRQNYYRKIAEDIKEHDANGIIYFGEKRAGFDIIDLYMDMISSHSYPKKMMLTSNNLGTSQEVANLLRRGAEYLHVSVISPTQVNNLSDFNNYVEKRFSRSVNGSEMITTWMKTYGKKCGTMYSCTEDIRKRKDVIPMLEAIVSFLLAFKDTHLKLCGSSVGLCSSLRDSSSLYYQMLQSIRANSNSVTIDGQSLAVQFDGNGDVIRPPSSPIYVLSVAKKNGLFKETFVTAETYHYNNVWMQNDDVTCPVVESRCLDDCDKCIVKKPPYVFILRSSEFIIAGTGPLHGGKDMDNCAETIKSTFFVRMQAFYYAVEQIRVITGIDFSTLYIDTCYAKLLTLSVMTEIFRSEDECYLTEPDGTEHIFSPNHFVVFIGDTSSGISLILQSFLKRYNIPQISYGSTSILLSDKKRYPTFLRNVPTDDEQAQVMIEVAIRNNWTSIGLIHTDTFYGMTGSSRIEKYAAENGICIAFRHVITKANKDAKELAFDLKNSKAEELPRPLILFAEHDILKNITKAIQNFDTQWTKRGNIFLASETWSHNYEIIAGTGDLFKGTLSVSMGDNIFNWTDSNSTNRFREYMKQQSPQNQQINPFFIKFWQQQFECRLEATYPSNTRCTSPYSSLLDVLNGEDDLEGINAKHIMVAGLSVAYAIREAIYGEQFCINESECKSLFLSDAGRNTFFRLLLTTKVPNLAGSHAKVYLPFQPSGKGRTNYDLYNLIKQGNGLIYQKVYTVTNSLMTAVAQPLYHMDGDQVSSLPSPNSCKSLEKAPLENMPEATNEVSTNMSVLALSILTLVLTLVILLLSFILSYKVYHKKAATPHYKYRYSDITESSTGITPPLRRSSSNREDSEVFTIDTDELPELRVRSQEPPESRSAAERSAGPQVAELNGMTVIDNEHCGGTDRARENGAAEISRHEDEMRFPFTDEENHNLDDLKQMFSSDLSQLHC